MAWDSQSDWQSTPDRGNMPGNVTPAQERMLSATSPLAGQARNTGATSREKGSAPTTEAQRREIDTQAAGQQRQQGQQAKQAQQASGAPDVVENVASRLGNFGHLLREKVNQFLTAGATSVGVTDQSQMRFDADGKAILTDDITTSTQPVVQEKRGQQEVLRGLMSPFAREVAGKLYGKQFSDVLQDLASTDPQLAQQLPQLLQMVQILQQKEAQGETNTPETLALMAQLESMDSTGMVSGLKRAMDDYNKMMGLGRFQDEGLKWYGDAGDVGYSLLDLANLGQEELEDEVQKSLIASSGLFGGDFEENLQRLYDTESEEVRQSNRDRLALQEQFSNAMQIFTEEYGGQFAEAREGLSRVYQDVADKLVNDLANNGDTQLALAWAEAFQSGEDLEVVLFQAMNDPNSGLNAEQKAVIANYIGDVKDKTLGEFGAWMDSLSKRGVINAVVGKDEQGNPIRQDIDLSPAQKSEILRTLNSTLPMDQKEAKIRDIVGETIIGGSTMKSQVESAVRSASQMGDAKASADMFAKSFQESMSTFIRSRTEDTVRMLLDLTPDEWEAMSQEQRTQALREAMQNPEFVKNLKEKVASKVSAEKETVENQVKEFQGRVETKKQELTNHIEQVTQQIEQVKNMPQVAMQEFATQVKDRFTLSNVLEVAQKLKARPEVVKLMVEGKLTEKQLVDVAKAFNYYAAYHDLAGQDPKLADLIYGGAAYAASVNPVDLLARGDVAGLVDLAKETDGALDNADQITIQYLTQAMANPRGKGTNLTRRMMEYVRNNDRILKDLQESAARANQAMTDVDTAATNVAEWAKNINQDIFNPDQLIQVALGAGKGAKEAYLDEALKAGIPPEAIVTDAQGIPYVKMGDGTYRPFNPASAPGIEDTLTAGVGISAVSTDVPTGFGAQVGTGADPMAGLPAIPPAAPAQVAQNTAREYTKQPLERIKAKSGDPVTGGAVTIIENATTPSGQQTRGVEVVVTHSSGDQTKIVIPVIETPEGKTYIESTTGYLEIPSIHELATSTAAEMGPEVLGREGGEWRRSNTGLYFQPVVNQIMSGEISAEELESMRDTSAYQGGSTRVLYNHANGGQTVQNTTTGSISYIPPVSSRETDLPEETRVGKYGKTGGRSEGETAQYEKSVMSKTMGRDL